METNKFLQGARGKVGGKVGARARGARGGKVGGKVGKVGKVAEIAKFFSRDKKIWTSEYGVTTKEVARILQ